jgi:hypothetical protein
MSTATPPPKKTLKSRHHHHHKRPHEGEGEDDQQVEEKVAPPPPSKRKIQIEEATEDVVPTTTEAKVSEPPQKELTEEDQTALLALEEEVKQQEEKQLVVQPNDLMLELAPALLCKNVYFKDLELPEFFISGVPNINADTKQYQAMFIKLAISKQYKQHFMNETLLSEAFHVLMPICALGYQNPPPYGNINARRFAPQVKDWHKGVVQMGSLGNLQWKWNPNAPAYDPIVLAWWDWLDNVLSPPIYAELKRAKLDRGKPWKSCTFSPENPNIRATFASCPLFKPKLNREDLNLLKAGQYKSYTEQLTRMCTHRGVVNSFLPFYQLPWPGYQHNSPLLLDWKKIANMPNGALHFAVLRVGVTVKDTCHLDFTICRFVYLGVPDDFNDMKECTLAELVRCIQPLEPIEGDQWSVKSATEESEDLDKEVVEYRKAQGPVPPTWSGAEA